MYVTQVARRSAPICLRCTSSVPTSGTTDVVRTKQELKGLENGTLGVTPSGNLTDMPDLSKATGTMGKTVQYFGVKKVNGRPITKIQHDLTPKMLPRSQAEAMIKANEVLSEVDAEEDRDTKAKFIEKQKKKWGEAPYAGLSDEDLHNMSDYDIYVRGVDYAAEHSEGLRKTNMETLSRFMRQDVAKLLYGHKLGHKALTGTADYNLVRSNQDIDPYFWWSQGRNMNVGRSGQKFDDQFYKAFDDWRVMEALDRIDDVTRQQRMFRGLRASQLAAGRTVTDPDECWFGHDSYENDIGYMSPWYRQIVAETQEADAWDDY
jgi:hypothetical protein